MICPECQSEMRDRGDEHFPDCEECGFVQYDESTLALIAEVKQEQAVAKAIFGRIPSFAEWEGFQRGNFYGE